MEEKDDPQNRGRRLDWATGIVSGTGPGAGGVRTRDGRASLGARSGGPWERGLGVAAPAWQGRSAGRREGRRRYDHLERGRDTARRGKGAGTNDEGKGLDATFWAEMEDRRRDQEHAEEGGAAASGGNSRVTQVAEGIRWVQKHPVLAAVIWVFGKVLETGPSPQGEERPHTSSCSERDSLKGRSKGSSEERESEMRESSSNENNSSHEQGSSSLASGRSSCRLSWKDDNGGSLVQYYEADRARFTSDSSETATVPTTGSVPGSRPEPGREPTEVQGLGRIDGGGDGQGEEDEQDEGEGESAMVNGQCGVGLKARQAPRGQGLAALDGDSSGNLWGGGTGGPGSGDSGSGPLVAESSRFAASSVEEALDGNTLHHCNTCRADMAGVGEEESEEASTHPVSKAGTSSQRDCSQSSGNVSSNAGSGISPLMGEGGGVGTGTWSPQWGWYVTMTPPQEHYASSTNSSHTNTVKPMNTSMSKTNHALRSPTGNTTHTQTPST